MALETCRHRRLDLLGGVERMFAQRNGVVPAHEQVQNIDVVFPGLGAVHQKPGARPLAQRVVHILGVVRKHAEGAVAAHDRIGARKAFHQHGGDLQLPGRRLSVAPLARQLVDVVDGPEADDAGVDDVVDEGLGVLTGLALIAVDIVGRQVLIAEGVAGGLAVIVDHAGHHLDQGCLPRPRRAVAHEGEDEAAKFGKGVQPPVEIIGHQHLRQPHGLILGDMVAHDLMWLLEGHCQRRGFRRAGRREALHGEVILFDPP